MKHMQMRYYLVYETGTRAGEEVTTVRIEIVLDLLPSSNRDTFEAVVTEARKMKKRIKTRDPLAKNFRIEKAKIYPLDD